MEAVKATFLGLPAARSRWEKARMTGGGGHHLAPPPDWGAGGPRGEVLQVQGGHSAAGP